MNWFPGKKFTGFLCSRGFCSSRVSGFTDFRISTRKEYVLSELPFVSRVGWVPAGMLLAVITPREKSSRDFCVHGVSVVHGFPGCRISVVHGLMCSGLSGTR